MGGEELMKLESKHYEKEWLVVEKAACNAMKGKKGKSKGKEPTKPKAHTPAPPLNSVYRSWMSQGHRENPIQVGSADDE